MLFFSLFIFQFCYCLNNLFADNNIGGLNYNVTFDYSGISNDELELYVNHFKDFIPYMEIEFKINNILKKIYLEFDLFWDDTPKTALNFAILLSRNNFPSYLNSTFHRLISNFMIQGGDITTHNGTGGLSIFIGNEFIDENFKRKHQIGSLSMANRGSNTNSSQFFITFIKPEWLDGKHVVFGQLKYDYINDFMLLREVQTKSSIDSPIYPIKIISCGMIKSTNSVL